jgi:hypothetical protein
MMRAKFLTGLCLATAGLFFTPMALAAESATEVPQDARADTPEPSKPVVTISKETTYLVEPLRDDGYVDYLAALNKRMSEGVTPENNALVPLMKIFGPKNIDEEIRARFFEMLGMEPVPDEGEYLVSFLEFVEGLDLDAKTRKRAEEKECERATRGPWSARQCPIVAQWISQNEKRLDLAVQAIHRPRFYSPMLAEEEPGMLLMVLLPTIGDMRNAARALKTRAMLRIQQGQTNAAWQDLLACHRLARLIAQGPTLVEGLVAIAIEHGACLGDAALAHHGKLSEDEARRYAREIRQLAPLPPMADKIDVAERYTYLDAVCHVAQKGVSGFYGISGLMDAPPPMAARWISRYLGRTVIDWDSILKRGNAWHDRLVAAARKPRGAERNRAIEAFEQALDEVVSKSDWTSLAGSFFQGKSPRTVISERLGNIFIAMFIPATSMVVVAEERSAVVLELAEISLALAAHRAAEGEYPRELDALVPDDFAQLPRDPFGEGTYRYQRVGSGFQIYSLGRNRTDDGGISPWDDSDEDGDDLVIRMPARK